MNIIDTHLRDAWVELFDEFVAAECSRDALRVLSVITADPRLGTKTITDLDDLEQTAQIIAESLDQVDLDRFGIDDQPRLRDEFLREVIAHYLDRLGRTDVSVETLDTGLGTVDAPDRSASGRAPSAAAPATTSTGSDRGSEKLVGAADEDVTTFVPPESEADETGGGDGTVLPFDPEELDLAGTLADAELSPDAQVILDDAIDIETGDVDIDELADSKSRLASLLENQNEYDTLVGCLGFAHLAVATPTSVEPYLGVLEKEFESGATEIRTFVLYIYLAVAIEDPTALLGHLEPVWGQLTSSADLNRAMSFDIAQRVSEEVPSYTKEHVDRIADGLSDSTPSVRRDAAATLLQIADDRPDIVVPYTGLLTEQLRYDDRSGIIAGMLLAKIARAEPAAAAPYLQAITAEIDPEAPGEKLAPVLTTTRELLIAGGEGSVPVDALVACLTHSEEFVRQRALTVCNELAKHDPELIQPEITTIVDRIRHESGDTARSAALVLSTLAEEENEAVEPYVDDVATLLDDEELSVDLGLKIFRDLAQSRPGALVPYLDRVVVQLDAESEQRRILAAAVIGYVSQQYPETIEQYTADLQAALEPSAQESLLFPLLDALGHVAMAHEEAVAYDWGSLTALLAHDSETVTYEVLEVFYAVAQSDPDVVLSQMDAILPLLESDDPQLRHACLRIIETTAQADQAHAEGDFDWLLTRISHPERGVNQQMIFALNYLATDRPWVFDDVPLDWYLTNDDPAIRSASVMAVANEPSRHADLLIDHLESITALFETENDERAISALYACRQLAKERPEELVSYVEELAAYLSHENDNHRKLAIDCLERIARDETEAVAPFVEEIAARSSDEATEVRRDAALLLGLLARENREIATAKFYQLQDLLLDNTRIVTHGATVGIAAVAQEHPEIAQQATEQIVGVIEQTDWETIISTGLIALREIASEKPARLVPHLEVIGRYLDAEPDFGSGISVEILGFVSQLDAEAVIPYLEDICNGRSDNSTAAPVGDILKNVAREAPSTAADHLDSISEFLHDDEKVLKLTGLSAIYYIADENHETIGEYLDLIADVVESDDRELSYLGAMILGVVSKSDPVAVEQYTDAVAAYLEGAESDDKKIPAVDMMYNVAVESPETVQPHLAVVEELEPEDEFLESLTDELIGLFQDAPAIDDDTDLDPEYDPSGTEPELNANYSTGAGIPSIDKQAEKTG